MSATQSNILNGNARQMSAVQAPATQTPPPVRPPAAQPPNPADIVEIRIKMPRSYYDTFSKFAQFLHKTQAYDPNTGKLMYDKVTNQPVMNLPSPDIQTYFMLCATQTYQAYLFMADVDKQRKAQQQAQAQPQQRTQ